MLVKEFKDFSQIQLRQLGAYASMTIEDFIREIESKGKVPNKFYKNLYLYQKLCLLPFRCLFEDDSNIVMVLTV